MPTTERLSAKRQYTTMACFACRERKVKCDGKVPCCSNCTSRNRDCRYQAFDKRKLPLRVAIELLSNRVSQLCCFIRDNGLQPPPMQTEKASTLANVLEISGFSKITESSPKGNNCPDLQDKTTEAMNKEAETDQPHTPSTTPPTTDRYNTTHINTPEENRRPRQHSATSSVCGCIRNKNSQINTAESISNAENALGSSPANLEHANPTFTDEEPPLIDESSDTTGIEELIDQLSDRVGSLKIGPRGETQFYGPTSTFNLVDMPLSQYPASQGVLLGNGYESLDRLEINQEVPINLEDHLISLFFSWHNPVCPIVDRHTYQAAKERFHLDMEFSPFYSESLRNAMCAIGAAFEARYHPTFVTFPRSLMDFFADRAKAFLEIELDHPSVATVQALVILSGHETGSKRDARGWLYSGMAIRLAFDLALHIDMSTHIDKGIISAADACLRRQVFWASYINDHLLGFSLGRPFRIHVEDVTVGKPVGHVNQFGENTRLPYMLSNPMDTSYGQNDYTAALLYQHIALCEIMSSCGYILYGTSGFSKSELQELNSNIVVELWTWKASLPSALQITMNRPAPSYLPDVLLLHMQYYQNIIYAHRPWMSKSYLQPSPPKGPGYLHARNMCIKAAISIAKILDLYEAEYTLRRIHIQAVSITSSAVLLLLFAAVSGYPSRGHDEIVLYLGTCLRALDEFGISWESAKRAKDFFLRLQRQWELRTRSFKFARRSDNNNNSGGGGNTEKRLRQERQGYSDYSGINDLNVDDDLCPNLLEGHADMTVDVDLDWMLMSDMPALPENRDGDFCSSASNQMMFDLQRPIG